MTDAALPTPGESEVETDEGQQLEESDEQDEQDEEEEEESESDDDDELLLFARISKGIQSSTGTTAQQNAEQKRRLLSKQEKAKEAERDRIRKDQHDKAKTREKQSQKSKANKRLIFTLESLRVADSHVLTPEEVEAQAKANATLQDETTPDLKSLLQEASKLDEQKKIQEAIVVLKKALALAKSQNNSVAALAAATLLGKECLKVELTRDAIDSLHTALQLTKIISGTTAAQKQSLVLALQNAYQNVGDYESAAEVATMYGVASSSSPVPSQPANPVLGTINPIALPQNLKDNLTASIHKAILSKDLSQLRMLVMSFGKTNLGHGIAAFAIAEGGVTALHVAAGRNDAGLVQALLTLGADVNAKDSTDSTPLLWAARFGGIGALEELLKSGARFDESLDKNELASWSPEIKAKIGALIASKKSS